MENKIIDETLDKKLIMPNNKIIILNDQQYEGVKKIRNWLKFDNMFFTLSGVAGSGKQQPIDCLVQTPNGPKKIGDISIGDCVFGINGNVIRVTGVFPQGIKQAYKIIFRDGTSSEAGEDHLWNVWTNKLRKNKKPTITLTTKEMLNNGLIRNYDDGNKLYKYSIPLCKPVEYSEKDLPIHPYILGALIGDGTNLGKTPIISTPDIDHEIIEIINKIKPNYIELHQNLTSNCPKYNFNDVDGVHINKFNKIFKNLGLNVKSPERFIPDIYKYSSIEQRYELLRGLMDTDGTSRGNRISFSTSSVKLLYDIIELVQSLGGIAIKNKDDLRYKNINYSVNIKTFENPFKLKRKADGWKFSWKNPPSRYIFSIEKSRMVEQACISVDAEDGLYLTDNFIVTHNTTVVKKILDEYRGGVVVTAPTHKAVHVISKICNKEGQTMQKLLGLRPDTRLDEFDPNRPIFNPIAAETISCFNLVIADEASMINKNLFELIFDKLENKKTKVLFIGDEYQIPPVGEVESIIFTNSIIEKHHLTKIERQADNNPIIDVYDNLRNNLENSDGGFLRKSSYNSNGEGVYFVIDKLEFRNLLLEKFKSDEFKENSDFCKLIAWRNESVMYGNKFIRNSIMGENSLFIETGDLIVGYRTITAKNMSYNIIENSLDYRVVQRDELSQNKYGINGYYVNIKEDSSLKQHDFERVFIIDINDEHSLHLYAEEHDRLSKQARENKKLWHIYYEFRRNNILMVNIDKYRDGEARGDSDIILKDIDYSYSITCHKSQGSTYSHVFIMHNDIMDNKLIKERNQLFYTSITRPTMSATVLTSRIDE